MLDGKKNKRVMLRITEEMWRQIYAIHIFDGLPVEHVVRILISKALSQLGRHDGNATLVSLRQQMSTTGSLSTFAEEIAKPKKSAPVNNRQQKLGLG